MGATPLPAESFLSLDRHTQRFQYLLPYRWEEGRMGLDELGECLGRRLWALADEPLAHVRRSAAVDERPVA